VVIQTWKLWVRSLVAIISARSSLVPVSMTRSNSGVHCWNSRCQFWSVDLGTTTRWGPDISR
jgi:hypothetical protein